MSSVGMGGGMGGGMSSGSMFNAAALGTTLVGSLFGGGGKSASSAYDPGSMNMLWGMQQEGVNNQVDALNMQADIALKESRRRMMQIGREGSNFRESQAQAYNNSGFLLEGSPMAVLNETRKLVGEEIAAESEHGFAQSDLLRRQAMQVGNEGRAQILGQKLNYGAQQAKTKIEDIQNKPNYAQTAASFVNNMFSYSNSLSNKYALNTPGIGAGSSTNYVGYGNVSRPYQIGYMDENY